MQDQSHLPKRRGRETQEQNDIKASTKKGHNRRISSIAKRVEGANTNATTSKVFGVAMFLLASLVIIYSLSYVIVVYGVFSGSSELGVTDTSPTSKLDDDAYRIYFSFIIFGTTLLAGLGSELLVWQMFLQNEWTHQTEEKYRAAQFVFPLMVLTAIGLATTYNYLAVPFLVLGMWKFGFPETILFVYSAIYETNRPILERLSDAMNGIGTVAHHSSSALFVGMLLTGALPPNRFLIESIIPVVCQHWFVLLKYVNKWAYVVIELILEAWAEWMAFSTLEHWYEGHRLGGAMLCVMLFAHWMYLAAAGINLFFTKNALQPNEVQRLNRIGNLRRESEMRNVFACASPSMINEFQAGSLAKPLAEDSAETSLSQITEERDLENGVSSTTSPPLQQERASRSNSLVVPV